MEFNGILMPKNEKQIIKFITSIIALENANETQQQKISTWGIKM